MTDEMLGYRANTGVWRTRVMHRRTKAKASAWWEHEGKSGPDTWWRMRPNIYTLSERNGKIGIEANCLLTPDTARVLAADLIALAIRGEVTR